MNHNGIPWPDPPVRVIGKVRWFNATTWSWEYLAVSDVKGCLLAAVLLAEREDPTDMTLPEYPRRKMPE